MKLSKATLFITMPIAFVVAMLSLTLLCAANFSTLTGILLLVSGMVLFGISISYLIWGMETWENMKTINSLVEQNEKKVLCALTNEYKKFEFYELSDYNFYDLISSVDNVKCLAKMDEKGYIHYQITIEEISKFPAPFATFLTHFKVPEPNN